MRLAPHATAEAPPAITREETVRLCRILRAARPGTRAWTEARNAIVEGNLRLAYAYVAEVAGRFRAPLDDLRQAAVLGLMRAAVKYDPDTGYAFSTYAKHWIRKAVDDAGYSHDLVRVPAHKRGKVRVRFERDAVAVGSAPARPDGEESHPTLGETFAAVYARFGPHLTRRQREVLLAVFSPDGSVRPRKETAAALGVSHQYVSQTLAEIRPVLIRLLEACDA